jgi:hypothetical protein
MKTILYAVETSEGIQMFTLSERPIECVNKMCGGMARIGYQTNGQVFERIAAERAWRIVKVTATLSNPEPIEFVAPK